MLFTIVQMLIDFRGVIGINGTMHRSICCFWRYREVPFFQSGLLPLRRDLFFVAASAGFTRRHHRHALKGPRGCPQADDGNKAEQTKSKAQNKQYREHVRRQIEFVEYVDNSGRACACDRRRRLPGTGSERGHSILLEPL